MNAVEVVGLIFITFALGIAVGKACADTLLTHQRDAALRRERVAVGIAYKAAVQLEIARRDLYIMDGPR